MDDKAQKSAKGLLFGPRNSRPLSVATRKQNRHEMKALSQKRQKESLRTKCSDDWREAAKDFLSGNTKTLRTMLHNDSAPVGVWRAEKAAVENAIALIVPYIMGYRDPQNQFVFAGTGDDLNTLLLLRERARERGCSDYFVTSAVGRAVVDGATFSANQEVKEKLIAEKDQIGPLPRVFSGGDFVDHLLCGRDSLCGKASIDDPATPTHLKSVRSVVTEGHYCQECKNLYHQNPSRAAVLSPDEWSRLLEYEERDCWLAQQPGWCHNGQGIKNGQGVMIRQKAFDNALAEARKNIACQNDF